MSIDDFLKENSEISITVNASDLRGFAKNIANQTAQAIINNQEEKVFSREEVMKMFNICSATLWRWGKYGLLQGNKIGRRRFYHESEIKRLIKHKEDN